MPKYGFIVSRHTAVFITIDKAEDEADAEKQALALVTKYIDFDPDDQEARKLDIAEAKGGLALKQKKYTGRVHEYQDTLTAEADESYEEDDEEHETTLGDLEEDEEEPQ